MQIYPSIDTHVVDIPIIAFDKLDGSNIRVEWTRKRGFSKFGTRRRLMDASEPVLGEAVRLFQNTFEDTLSDKFKKLRYEKATVFLEFTGPNSFAGLHEDEEHTLTLLDVHLYKQGLLTPKDFLKHFEGVLPTPEVLYTGKPNQDFIRSVRESTLEGMTFEGVVCKGGLNKYRQPTAFKIKSQAWLDRLKTKCGDDEALFERLK